MPLRPAARLAWPRRCSPPRPPSRRRGSRPTSRRCSRSPRGSWPGVGEPGLILPPGASPHGYALRPSEARLLQDADLVVWIGPALTPWLADPIATLAPTRRSSTLADRRPASRRCRSAPAARSRRTSTTATTSTTTRHEHRPRPRRSTATSGSIPATRSPRRGRSPRRSARPTRRTPPPTRPTPRPSPPRPAALPRTIEAAARAAARPAVHRLPRRLPVFRAPLRPARRRQHRAARRRRAGHGADRRRSATGCAPTASVCAFAEPEFQPRCSRR